MRAFICSVFLLVSATLSNAAFAAGVGACQHFESEAGSLPNDTCPSYIVGATHGLHHAMSKENYGSLFCLPEQAGTQPTAPYNQAISHFRQMRQDAPSMAMLLATLSAMMDEFPCEGAAPDPDLSLLTLGQVLGWCKAMLDADREGATCSSYLFGVGQAFVATSGKRKSRAWLCPPGDKLTSESMLTLALKYATEDPTRQDQQFTTTMAALLEERYPCD